VVRFTILSLMINSRLNSLLGHFRLPPGQKIVNIWPSHLSENDVEMMQSLVRVFVALAAVVLIQGTALAAAFTASLDRNAMMLGEQATLSLKFDDVQLGDAPGIPPVAGLEFQYTGASTMMTAGTGGSSSSVTYSYQVTPQHDGSFTIPALQVDVGGQRLVSSPIRLVVTKAGAASLADVAAGHEPAFMKLLVPKDKIFVGEPMVAELELYVRDDVEGLNGFQMTSSPTDGFNVGKTAETRGARRRVQVGDRVYTLIPLSLPLTAIRTGSLTLGPFVASVVLSLPASNNQGGDPFMRFFRQSEQHEVSVTTQPVNLDVLPLPEKNRPANFTGAVGDFTMSATAGPTTVTVGDPITVRVQISGHGALDAVTLPLPGAWHDFKSYPPTAKFEAGDQFGFQGTKTFEQIISPETADVHELPPLTFSFFNPDDDQYHTLTQAAVPLVVRAAGATPLPANAAKNSAPENQPPADILPIKERLGTLAAVQPPLIAQPVFLAAQGLPVIAFLAAFIWRRRADNLANNPRLRRHRAVAQLIASGLDDLKKYAAANQPDEFFATLFRLLQEQLGERLDCPASAITENVVDEQALLRAAPEATRAALREQFQLCNQARYAPVRGTSELNSVAAQFEKLIRELQELKS
jgi:hypothetical protein